MTREVGQTRDAGFQIGVSRTLPLPPDVVWQFLTGPAGRALWLGDGVGLDVARGAPYTTADGTTGEVRGYQEGARLRLTHRPAGADAETTVQVTVSASGTGAARAGVTLYRVVSVKRSAGRRTFVAIDGGFGDNPRAEMYGARYTLRCVGRPASSRHELVTVVGRYCEAGDVLAEDVLLPADTHPGDLLAVACTGAYHHSMASSYNLVPRPPVVAVRDETSRLLLRRETDVDMRCRDVGL